MAESPKKQETDGRPSTEERIIRDPDTGKPLEIHYLSPSGDLIRMYLSPSEEKEES